MTAEQNKQIGGMTNEQLTRLAVDSETGIVELSAVSGDYKTAAEQLLYFQNLEEIENIELNEVVLEEKIIRDEEQNEIGTEEAVEFEIQLTIKKEILYKSNETKD